MKRILLVVGARPNFMKIAPVAASLQAARDLFEYILVHTGQHYDTSMSSVFFQDLEMPAPDVNLEVGSGSHAWQTAEVMKRFEPVVREYRPDWILVPGDVNSTLACALVASKMNVPVAHLEAGLRSFDRTMPEEINRVLTDQVSDLLFVPSLDGQDNLIREGIPVGRIRFVGNAMIDSLIRLLPRARGRLESLRRVYELHGNYVLATLHRPSNVDDPETLRSILLGLNEIAALLPVVLPVHPRTRERMSSGVLPSPARNLKTIEPLGYLDFLALESQAHLVITDSGGVQEETTFLGIPCLTVRPNTERPVTVLQGTNSLVGSSREDLVAAAMRRLQGSRPGKRRVPPLWDGHTGDRVVEVLRRVVQGFQAPESDGPGISQDSCHREEC